MKNKIDYSKIKLHEMKKKLEKPQISPSLFDVIENQDVILQSLLLLGETIYELEKKLDKFDFEVNVK